MISAKLDLHVVNSLNVVKGSVPNPIGTSGGGEGAEGDYRSSAKQRAGEDCIGYGILNSDWGVRHFFHLLDIYYLNDITHTTLSDG
jgi:hypothetical protein